MAALFIALNQTALGATVSFTSPGGPYTFTVPAGVTSIRAQAIGGGGANWNNSYYTRGADVSATLPVTPGQTLYVYVAGNGGQGSPGNAGVNGGGSGGSSYTCGGGGGASDIRTNSADLSSRILVAGGGGGANFFYAGGDAGQPGVATDGFGIALPGTSTNGGAAGSGYFTPATAGAFGVGGNGGGYSGANVYGGGGGGGWYGGGGGSEYGGGAGGSSYVISSATSVTNALSSTPPSPQVNITYFIVGNQAVLKNPTRLIDGSFSFSFTNIAGANFTVLASTNVSLPLASWTSLGSPTESPAGTYQFTDTQATNNVRRFYRVTSP